MDAFDFNLRHLRAFIASARCASLSAAARDINLSQSAITQAIAKLERQIGLPLFERLPSGVAPTEAALLFLPRAIAALGFVSSNRVTAAEARAFVSLAKNGSYVATAADTGIRQASLHRSVAGLAASLGQRLVERRGRGVAITRRGLAVARRFQLAESELRSAIAEMEALKGREVGRIVVGAMPMCRAKLLPRIIAEFHKAHPEAGISIVEGSFSEIVQPLRSGDIDLMLGALRDTEGGDLAQQALFIDRPIIVGRLGHPLAAVREPSAKALAAYPWIVPRKGTPLRAQWTELFRNLTGRPPRVAVESGSVMVARELLIDGDFLTLVSSDQVALEVEAGRLVRIGGARSELSRTIGMISRSDWRPTRMQQEFVDLVVAHGLAMEHED